MAQEIGSAKAIHGHVTALGPEGARTLSVGSPVFKGDTLSTAKGAAGSIQFLDKTVLNVGEASKVSLDQYVYDASKGSGQVLFKMAQGTFRAVTGEIVKQNPESFKMQSPLATIGIRGTETAHTVPGPGQNEASESHLVMVFDGKPVIVQPLGGGAFQVLSQAGVKVEVGKFGAGPVMVMTPQEYKYYQALTVTGLQQGVPQDTVTPQGGQQGKDPKVQAAQDAANKAAADAQAKAAAAAEAKAAAEAAAKAAAEAAASGDPAAKAAADAAAKAAAEAAAKAMADAKAAADLAAKALSEAFAAQQALALAAAAKAAADAAAKAAADAANQTTPLTLNPGSIISFSTSTDSSGHTVTTITVTPPAGGEGQSGSGTTPVIVSEVAQDIINPIDHNNDTPPGGDDTPNTPPVAGTLDLSGGSASAMVNLMAQPGFYESNGELTYLADNTANVIGSNHDDTIFGSGSANDLQGGAGNDLVYGMGGNDTIAGGEGSDTLEGGTGNDAISGGNGADILSAGSGMDSMGGGLDNMDGGNGGDMISMGRSLNNTNGLDTIQGGNGADVLLFTDNGAGANDLDTTRGVEAVVLGDATTNITFPANFTAADWADIGRVLDIDGSAIGGDTSATFTFDGSAATEDGAFAILGGHHDDTLTGGAGADSIDGGDGDDLIKGGAGDDSLSGGDGDDTIAGGAGDDDINGGGGDNTVSYALSASGVAVDLAEHYSDDGLGGHDQFTDIQNVIGSAHADSITGDESGNAIAGGAGDDNLSGGAGDDTIEGGAGADTLSGGDGDDTFVFNAGDVVYGESIDGGMGGTTIKTLGDVNFAQAGEGNLLTLDQQNGVIHTVELAQDSTATFDWDTFEGMSPQSVVIIGEEDGAERIELLSFDNGNTFRPDVFVNAEGMNGDGDRLHFVGGNQTDPDILDYSGYNEDNRFSINMASGIVSRDGGGFTHSFEQIDKVIGGAGDDTFIGALSDVTLDGGLNYNDGNTISYEGAGSGVVINISGNVLLDAAGETLAEAGTATNGTGTDTLLKFQNVTGGDGNDTISGSDETNVINAGDGDDHIYGSFGDDAYDGGAGTNTLDYSQFISDFPLTIDMSAGTASSGIDFTHNFSNIQHVIGGAGDDDITGSGTGDTIEGGAGADNLVGSGADVLSYEHDPDGVTVNLSDSTVGQWDLGAHLARDGHEALDQVTGFHIVMGSSHNDNLMGSEDADTLYGGHGDDTFFGSTGADVIHGGDGTDSLTFADFNEDHQLTLDFAAHTVTDAFGSGFTQTYDGIEMLGGGNGADTYNGSTGDDRFLASYGDDVINGNGGADTLDYSREGGASAISFGREMGPYWIWDTSGSGKDFVSGIEKIILNDADYTSSFSSSQHLTDGMLGDIAGGSTFTLDGSQLSGGHALYADGSNVSSAYDLSFLGGAGNDILSGGAGSDTLSGGSGNDSLTGGAGNDSLKMDAHLTGEDEIDGGLGVDTLSFTQQDQGGQQVGDLGGVTGVEIVKLGDADTQLWISGDSGCSNLGDDLDASHGFLTIDGSGLTGSHALTFDVSDIGSDITYQIFGGEGADSLCGGDNADTLFGGLGDDTLLGGGGADTLEGGGGADVLFGQGGADSLTGNAGNDTFWFAGTGSTAAVADFASGADTLCFYTGGGDFSAMSSPWAFSTISSGTNHSGATAQATLTYDTQDHTLYFDADGTGASAATAVATFANGAAVAQTDIVTTPVDITVH